MIRNAHRNLGHPSNFSLVRLMSVAKCHPDMIAYAANMSCPTCKRRNPPLRIPKTTMPYRPAQFHQVVGVNLKWIKDVARNTFYMLNILDLATSFNLGICLRDKSAQTLSEASSSIGSRGQESLPRLWLTKDVKVFPTSLGAHEISAPPSR